ncbi:MAG TPA: hypothetical protein VML91_25215 [Burkholderiales bacterium]|nr:hypothetical protein [Burkholderiales bacterium]
MQGTFENPLWFLAFFLVAWVAVTVLLAVLSGWPSLAKRFRTETRPPGTPMRGQVSRIGLVTERNVTGLVVSDRGLYLWTLWPFRLLRPPLLIPWAAVRSVRERSVLWTPTYVVDVSASVEIALRRKAYDAIQPFLPPSATQGESPP